MVFVILMVSTQACTLSPFSRKLSTPALLTQVVGGDGFIPTQVAVSTMTPASMEGNPLRVVYAKDDGIWLWGASPSPKRLTSFQQDSFPEISDDGQVIVFRRGAELWAVDVNGENERLLVSIADLSQLLPIYAAEFIQPHQFDFVPHTHSLYFNTKTLTDAGPLFLDNLLSVNADSGELRLLLDATQGGGKFIFSPDRTKIALPSSDKINIVNADGTGVKTVFTFLPVKLNDDLNYLPEIVWLPDGSGFKTVIPAADASAKTRFMFISVDGVIVAKLAEFAASPVTANPDSWPFISHDGAKVLYTKLHDASLELHIIDAGTADQMFFSHDASTFGVLGWTPDSAHVFYWLGDQSQLWLGPQPSDAIALSDVAGISNLAWVNAQSYLFVTNTSQLYFRTLGQPSILLDDDLAGSSFDFIVAH